MDKEDDVDVGSVTKLITSGWIRWILIFFFLIALLYSGALIGGFYACDRSNQYFLLYPKWECFDLEKHPECELSGKEIQCKDNPIGYLEADSIDFINVSID